MPTNPLPLIAGAGPVGLAAALFLAREGVPTRLIDRAERTSPYSRALAVNPRTLEILEPTGITQRILKAGIPIHGARFWRRGHVLAELSFASLEHRYPHMVALSQAMTQRFLEESLEAAGGRIERRTELADCRSDGSGVNAQLRGPAGEEHDTCPWLLAADGAHSVARQSLGLSFDGTRFDREWHLVDLPLTTRMAEDHAHIFFLDGGGFLFCLRVVDDALATEAPVWRVMGDLPDPVEHLPGAAPAGAPVWTSRFHVAHRLAQHLQSGRIFLAGDAAHIHSPVGARGMNLGIEDAWVFARLVATGQMDRYEELRRATDQRVVARVERISRLARGESRSARVLRRLGIPLAVHIPTLQRLMLETVTGLDHPLPRI